MCRLTVNKYTHLEMPSPPLGRALLFLVGCIGSRSAFAALAAVINTKYLPYLGAIALLPVIGWIYILATGSRQTGPEAGGRIWWNNLRPVHAALWACFAAAALVKNSNAYLFLVADVIFGLGAWINHHFL